MMIDVLIVHGSFGSPYQNWAPWLYSELSEQGKTVIVPHFTSEDLQSLNSWLPIMNGYADLISEETTIISHSLGPAFCVDWIAQQRRRIKKLVAVAPFYDFIDIPEFDQVNKTFFVDEKLISEASELISERVCVYSDDDPYVPIELSKRFASLLKAKTEKINGGGHLNSGAGYTSFPKLLELV